MDDTLTSSQDTPDPATDDDFNPLSAAFADDPFSAFAQAREKCPVHHTTQFSPEFYSLTKFSDIFQVLNDADAEQWSARYGSTPQFQRAIGFNQDVDASREFRALFRTWIPANAGVVYADLIDSTVNDLIDEMTADGRTRGDFAAEFAVLLPIRIIAQLIGVPPEDAPEIKAMTDEFLGAFCIPDRSAGASAVRRLDAYFEPHLEHRRALLRDAGVSVPDETLLGSVLPNDLLGFMLVKKYDGRNLTPAEISYVLATALTGGNDTTSSMLTNVTYRLLSDPSLWQRIVDDESLIQPAIEESLRMDPPVLGLFRTTVDDVTVSGCPIPEKSKVMLLFGSANRDPEQWEDPDEFRLDRPMKFLRRHLAFGGGAHFCLGAPLARAEGNRALQVLRTRLPHLRLDGPSERIPQYHLWGRQTLPVRWDDPRTEIEGD